MKTENENKRTKRKEIQFSETEYAAVEKKANAARLSVAVFIREAALSKELSAALTIEESERIKRTTSAIRCKSTSIRLHGWPTSTAYLLYLTLSENTLAAPTNILRLAHGVKWICLPTNPNKNSGSSLPQKCVSFKRRTRNYRKRRPTITFIPPRVNAFSASGIIAGFIPTTEASTGISRLPTIRLIYFRLKLVGHTLIMRFRYGMCMCIGISVRDKKYF